MFDVKEGPRVYIDRIDIVGNTATLDYVIRRRLLVSEGDAYNRALVDRSKQNVRALGFFKDVDITNAPGSAPDRTSLLVHVTEQPTGQLSFSAGYSSVDKLVTDVGVSQSNFRGRGQDLRLRVSLGTLRSQVDLSFTEPHFLDRDLAAGWDVYAYRYNFSQYSDYDNDVCGHHVKICYSSLAQCRPDDTLYVPNRRCDHAVADDLCIPRQRTGFGCPVRGARILSDVACGLHDRI